MLSIYIYYNNKWAKQNKKGENFSTPLNWSCLHYKQKTISLYLNVILKIIIDFYWYLISSIEKKYQEQLKVLQSELEQERGQNSTLRNRLDSEKEKIEEEEKSLRLRLMASQKVRTGLLLYHKFLRLLLIASLRWGPSFYWVINPWGLGWRWVKIWGPGLKEL